MRLQFVGAAQNVTGSKHILEINGKRFLLDCGLFQGHRKDIETLNRTFPFDPKSIDAIVLSHAHIDHCGAIPALVKEGFEGPIYCTHATRDLCAIMLRDSAHIHEKDAEWISKKKKINAEPLYTLIDTEKALSYFRSVSYGQRLRLGNDIYVTFNDAGHILGSANELWEINDHNTGQDLRFGFTGDLGRRDLPILKDPVQLENLDVLLSESTYGNRLHDEIKDVEAQLTREISAATEREGKIIIPAFSMGRTQEILYLLKLLMKENKIPTIPIFVDSPLAASATEVFALHPECFDEDLCKLMDQGVDPFHDGEGIQYTRQVEESKALNDFPGSCFIISASGMCEFGRIRHHLANHITNPKNLILVVGFMAENTLGRHIVDGHETVKIFGDEYRVNAEVKIYNAFSGHADQKGLLRFAKKAGDVKNVFLVHGELESQEVFKGKLNELDNVKGEVFIPVTGDTFELQADKSWKMVSYGVEYS